MLAMCLLLFPGTWFVLLRMRPPCGTFGLVSLGISRIFAAGLPLSYCCLYCCRESLPNVLNFVFCPSKHGMV